ncbi:MAG: tRNA (adenosine(37)-N6)-threonylcarbamoyltransferase complex dimerization subunit type 1 TsaB [Anaerolineaceae bacterium]|nr:tRNA (adenosine(37)-N6)-threonylcarbamoyltransferase complex dimerization subunit type 1 TsaB [Anaerolineaceae bacterium]
MLLSIDTSTQWIGLSLYDGDMVRAESVWKSSNYHTVELAPAIERLLKQCDLVTSQLSVLAVALGPGSFTSLRIGLAIAKGMALSLNIPIVGIPTLDILAAAHQPGNIPLLAVLQAGRGKLASQLYTMHDQTWVPLDEIKIFSIKTLEESITASTLVCGELTGEERRFLQQKNAKAHIISPAQSLRRPSILSELAWTRWQSGDTDETASLSPIYLHTGTPIPA